MAVIDNSTSALFFIRCGQEDDLVAVDRIEDAYVLLNDGNVDAVVRDAPVLQYYAKRTGRGEVQLVGP